MLLDTASHIEVANLLRAAADMKRNPFPSGPNRTAQIVGTDCGKLRTLTIHLPIQIKQHTSGQ
jgi:hypothetical protein